MLAALWLVLALPWLLGFKTIPFDAAQQFYPAVAFTVQQLHRLEPPWWNPYLFGGYPQFADPQAMTFQPTVVLPMLVSSLPSITWFGTVVLLHVLFAGLGAVRLGRSYGLGVAAQLMFALVVMYGGVAASRLQHVPMMVSYAFLPWLGWALRRLAARPAPGNALLAGVLGGLCALQMTQLTYLIALCAIGAGGAIAWRQPSQDRRLRCLAALALAAAAAALISAPQWLSTFAFLPFSNRVELPPEASIGGAISWHSLGTLVAGGLLSNAHGRYWGAGDLSQDYLYLGIVPLVVWLGWGGSPRRRALTRGLLAAALVALAYALGPHTPLYSLLFDHLPGLHLFRRPADALYLFVPVAGLLAACALQNRLDEPGWRPHWPGLAAVSLLVGFAIVYTVRQGETQSLVWFLPVVVFAGGTLLLLRPAAAAKPAALISLLALLVVDLYLHNLSGRFYGTGNVVRELFRDAGPPDAGVSEEARVLARLRAMPSSGAIPERVEMFGMNRLTNAAAVRGVSMTTGYNPLVYRPYAVFFGARPEPLASEDGRTFTDWAPSFDSAAFDLLGLRTIVSATRIRERDSVLPRILNPRAVRAHEQFMPPAPDFRATDFGRVAWVPADELRAVPCDPHAAGEVRIGRVNYAANRIDIEYRSPRSAWLVVNEIGAPGWTAEVDGRELPLLRANGLFRGVCAPAGDHALKFSFSPLRMIRAGWTHGADDPPLPAHYGNAVPMP
jgi:hypothetical protein